MRQAVKPAMERKGKMEIRTCKKCGFILGTRPNSKDVGGVCLACLNKDRKHGINWEERQKWLTQFIQDNKNEGSKWECVVGVSGGKDSCTIVKRLIERHGVKNPLLVHVCDEFTPSEAGIANLDNLVKTYDLDLLNFRCAPQTFVKETRKSFFEKLHPYNVPIDVDINFDPYPILWTLENAPIPIRGHQTVPLLKQIPYCGHTPCPSG